MFVSIDRVNFIFNSDLVETIYIKEDDDKVLYLRLSEAGTNGSYEYTFTFEDHNECLAEFERIKALLMNEKFSNY